MTERANANALRAVEGEIMGLKRGLRWAKDGHEAQLMLDEIRRLKETAKIRRHAMQRMDGLHGQVRG